MKKFLCLVLIALLICLPACTKNKNNNEKDKNGDSSLDKISAINIDTDPMKKSAVNALNSLEDTVLSKKGITIYSATNMPIVPENENTVYSYNLAQRNRMFEKKYSTSLNQFREESDLLLDEAYRNMLSGIGFADLFAIPAKDLHRYAEKGILLGTNALIGADFEADWFDKDLMERASNGNDAYAVYGDLNKDISSYYCLYVNRTLLSGAELKMPYSEVESGKWTWDKLLEITKNFGAANESAYLLSAESNTEIANVCFKSAGYDYITSGYKVTPAVSFAKDENQALLEILRSLTSTKRISNLPEDFTGGTSLFFIGTVGDMNKVKFTKDDWCLLPLPKASAGQENYMAYMNEEHTVITCFAGAANSSNLFYALEGLNAASYGGYLTEAYYNDLIINSLRDSDTLNMLDYITGVKNGVQITDFTDYHASAFPELYTHTREALANAAASDTQHIFNVEENAKKALNGVLEKNF